jgi:hypothetical protein
MRKNRHGAPLTCCRIFALMVRALFIMLIATSTAVGGRVEDARRLLDSATARYNAQVYEPAADLYLQAIDASRGAPEFAVWTIRRDAFYNAACCYSLLQLRMPALWYLDSALRNGFWDMLHIRFDNDLKFIRGGTTYDSLIGSVDRTRDSLQRLFRSLCPPTYRSNEADGDTPAPLLIVLHPDRERAEETMQRWQGVADSLQAVLVCPRAPGVASPYEFTYPMNPDSVLISITHAIAAARATGAVDTTRIVLAGHGLGGYIAWSFGFRHPSIFRGVLDLNGFCNLAGARPLFPAIRKRGLCVAGLYDPLGSSAQGSLLLAAQAFRPESINYFIGPGSKGIDTVLPDSDLLVSLRWILE